MIEPRTQIRITAIPLSGDDQKRLCTNGARIPPLNQLTAKQTPGHLANLLLACAASTLLGWLLASWTVGSN